MQKNDSLKAIVLIPIMIIIALSIYFLSTSYTQYKEIKNENKNLAQIGVLKEFLLTVSKERENAVLSITNDINEYIYNYKKSSVATNKSIENIVNLYNKNKGDHLIYKIIKDIKRVVNIREKVVDKKISYKTLFATYDILNSDILTKIKQLKNTFSKNNINAYYESISLVKSLEDERDFITNIFKDSEDIENLYMIKIFKNSNISQTLNLLDSKIQNSISKELNTNEFITIVKKTNKIKNQLLTKGYISDLTQKEWIELEDKKIDYLVKSINIIENKLHKNLEFNLQFIIAKILLSISLLLMALYFLYKYNKIKKYSNEKDLNYLVKKATSISNLEYDLDEKNSYKIIENALDKIELDKKKTESENASKLIFLANMSHEIRTPINGIVGFSDLLKKSSLNQTQKEYVEVISKSTENLLEIINNILDISKLESKKVEIEEVLFSPIEEIESAVELFIAKAAKKDINLTLKMLPEFTNYLLGDSLKLKEILINLISNSIKFTQNGGEIEINIKKIASNKQKDTIYFEVKDNGIGMSKDELNDIFEAFTQADSTITRKYGGTGLGLTISSNYVKMMGGELEVESKKDKGTKFFFTLEFEKSKPLKSNKYKNYFKNFDIVVGDDGSEFTKYLKNYFSYFSSNTTLLSHENIQNSTTFDMANLIVLTKDMYENFKDIKKSDKDILIISPTSDYLKQNHTLSTLCEPILFNKVVNFLSKSDKTISKPTKDSKTYNILVAEDNDINMQLIEEFFNQYKNITIDKAKDGDEAIDLFLKNRYDLILMDITMPNSDGISATKKIVEYENINSIPHTPIIALTANVLRGDKEKYLSSGMDEYIKKPVNGDELIQIFENFSIVLNPKEEVISLIKPKEVEKDTKSKKKKEILIYKKSEVETKIFKKVLSNKYTQIDTVNSKDKMLELMDKNEYQAILIDKEIDDIDFENFEDIRELKKL